jgi:alpha-N-acetylglucosaminidase
MKRNCLTLIACLLCALTQALACKPQESPTTADPVAETNALIHRLIGNKADKFQLILIPGPEAKDSFYLDNQGSQILIKGTSALALAKGFQQYLHTECKTSVSWYLADSICLPAILPAVANPRGEVCRFEHRFFLNYCTFGYTMLWWHWDQWQRLIDWMALNGINMPLAITGQEYIWQRVWRKFGMSDEQIRAFFTGPSHLPWQRMGNLDRWLGPLPQAYIDGQFDLQKKILERERALGMHPILPAFAGHIPKDIIKAFPKSKITDLGSYDTGPENDAYFLDPMDPLFIRIQKAYLSEQQALLGSDHYYGADPFNEMDPPSWDPSYLASVSHTIYSGMKAVDPQAVWTQMGWTFYYDRKHWTNPRLESMIKAVPSGKMIILDYFCEQTEVWRSTDAFFNTPYIWCYLGNFGGNTQMVGPLLKMSKLLPAAEADPNHRQLAGIGTTLEGFGVNSFVFEWLFDYAWNMQAADPYQWIKEYADTRTGHTDPVISTAWVKLLQLVYDQQVSGVGIGNIIQSEPMLKGNGGYSRLSQYDYTALGSLLPQFLLGDSVSYHHPAFTRDLVVGERQVLANLGLTFRDLIAKAYYKKDSVSFHKFTHLFLDLCDDLDALCGSQHELLLGDWIASARSFGNTDEEKNYYEKSARVLITTWGGEDNPNANYASKDWSGLISTYYKPRWELFFQTLDSTISSGEEPDMKAFNKRMNALDWSWNLQHAPAQHFPSAPVGDPASLCRALYAKWAKYL